MFLNVEWPRIEFKYERPNVPGLDRKKLQSLSKKVNADAEKEKLVRRYATVIYESTNIGTTYVKEGLGYRRTKYVPTPLIKTFKISPMTNILQVKHGMSGSSTLETDARTSA